MRGRFSRNLAAFIVMGASLGGCVQATRHSNTMVFGTNTTFGLSAGQDVGGIPSFTVGYRRQEAVLMPLVANTSDNGRYQAPCNIETMAQVASGQTNPCLLAGRNATGGIDTYSVLASFGADFGGSGTQGSGSGRLAQFFSTGLAAQTLAAFGGAALVSDTDAAAVQAAAGTDPALAAALLNPANRAAGIQAATTMLAVRGQLATHLATFTDPAAFATEVERIERAVQISTPGRLFSEPGCVRGGAIAPCIQAVQQGAYDDRSATALQAAIRPPAQ